MGSYSIPSNKLKGEGRFLMIFSTKSLIGSAVGAAMGLPIFFILKTMGMELPSVISLGIFGALGYAVTTIKFPNAGKLGRKFAGETMDQIVVKYLRFKKGKKIYSSAVERKEPSYINTASPFSKYMAILQTGNLSIKTKEEK